MKLGQIDYASLETQLIQDLEKRANNSLGWAERESLR